MSNYWRNPNQPLDGTTNVVLVPEVHGPHTDWTECVEVTLTPAVPDLSYDELLDYVADNAPVGDDLADRARAKRAARS